MPNHSTDQHRRRLPATGEIVTEEGGVAHITTGEVHEPWNPFHEGPTKAASGRPTTGDDVPAGMEGSYYL